MKFSLLLNDKSGSVQSTGVADLRSHIHGSFTDAGHSVLDAHGNDLQLTDKLKRAANSGVDGIIVCGGDGTVSAAASVLAGSDIALCVLPGGTMNLYARTLQIPLDVMAAVPALAAGKTAKADLGKANDRVFVHQFATGFQTRAVKIRNRMRYGSKLSKMYASTKAISSVIFNPPHYDVEYALDGHSVARVRSSAFAVTNNIFGVGHIPYADDIDGGILGLYYAEKLTRNAAIKLVRDAVLGVLHDNDEVEMQRAITVDLHFPKLKKRDQAVIDGELVDLQKDVKIQILPAALNVVLPNVVKC